MRRPEQVRVGVTRSLSSILSFGHEETQYNELDGEHHLHSVYISLILTLCLCFYAYRST